MSASMMTVPTTALAMLPSDTLTLASRPVFGEKVRSSTNPSGLPDLVATSIPPQMMHSSRGRPSLLQARASKLSSPRVHTRPPSITPIESSARNTSSRLTMPAMSGRLTMRPTTLLPSGEKTRLWTLPTRLVDSSTPFFCSRRDAGLVL